MGIALRSRISAIRPYPTLELSAPSLICSYARVTGATRKVDGMGSSSRCVGRRSKPALYFPSAESSSVFPASRVWLRRLTLTQKEWLE
jgi:hypothetical protein